MPRVVTCLIAGMILCAAYPAMAGNNAAGQAMLSWTPSTPCNGPVCDLPSFQQPVHPLYLLLDDAPDIQQLQVTIRWHPFNELGSCYGFLPASADTESGWSTTVPPGGSFSGEHTSAWGSIVFPPGSSKSSVVYWVAEACDSLTPADFCLASVKAMDSSGAIDTLAINGNASIMGGTQSGCPTPGGVGNNAGGTVRLSWDREGQSSTLAVPPAPSFPLYLHFNGAPDVKQLAITLRWIPYDSLGCYSIVTGSADPFCGWVTAIPPNADFDGDSTYTRSIIFPPSADHNCLVEWVSAACSDTAPPAKFHVADIRTRDSNGIVDTLTSIGGAKILGGWWPDSLPPAEQFSSPPPAAVTALRLAASPNPANSAISIQFDLPGRMPHELGIYDVSGRLIRRVELDESLTGSFHWNLADATGRRVRVGLYFARLFTPVGVRVVRLAVVR